MRYFLYFHIKYTFVCFQYQIPELLILVSRNDVDGLRDLIKTDPDLNITWPDGLSGLHVAAQCGFLEVGKLLIENKANVNCSDHYGCSPLHYASQSNNVSVCSRSLHVYQ